MTNADESRPGFYDCRFTLPGVLLIILIFIVFASLFIPAQQALRESAKRAACIGNLSNAYAAMQNYVSSFGRGIDYMPHTGDAFFTCLLGHTGSEHPSSYVRKAPCRGNLNLYVCPSSSSNDSSVTPGGAMADFLGPSRHPLVPAGNPSALIGWLPSQYPIACDKPGNHKGGGNCQ